MSSRLPARRFREAQLLIGAALLMLVAMVVVEMVGFLAVARLVEQEARGASTAAAHLLASRLASPDSNRFVAGLREEGWGVAVISGVGVVERAGEAGPAEPAWWPWASRAAWEAGGQAVAGPLPLAGRKVLVAYQPVADGRHVRAVVPVPRVVSWLRGTGAALGVAVALGCGLLVWAMITRVLAPYRDLLAEASRVAQGTPGKAEDLYLVETFRDTVRRMEASEAALRRRADDLEILAEVLTRGSAAGVVITDRGGTVRAANAAAREMLPALSIGGAVPAELAEGEANRRLGPQFVEVRRLPLLAANGADQGAVIFLADRSAVASLERALVEREQMAALGELAAGMTHELRNALATMRGYLRLLPDAGREDRERFSAAINEEAEGLTTLLDRFLRFAQPSDLHREPLDLKKLVNESARKVKTFFPTLALSVEGEPAAVVGDALAIGVALENLLRNAAEAVAPAAGSVSVRLETRPGVVRVVVDDDGPGVSDELKDRLFIPFVSSKPSGGLGLALARRFARLHGGDVEYEARPRGGSRFAFWMPRQGVS